MEIKKNNYKNKNNKIYKIYIVKKLYNPFIMRRNVGTKINEPIEQNQPKQMKKSQLKKTIISLNKFNVNQDTETQNDINNAKIKSEKNMKPNVKDNRSEYLLKLIIKAFYLSNWKKKVKAMKYASRAYNPRRINFKKLITQISLAIKQHKFDYFNEIVENMDSMPMPKNIKHDINFGTIRIVNKEFKNNKLINDKKNTNEKVDISKEEKNKSYQEISNEKSNKENKNINTNNKINKSILQPKINNVQKYMNEQYYNNANKTSNITRYTQQKANSSKQYNSSLNSSNYSNYPSYNNSNIVNANKTSNQSHLLTQKNNAEQYISSKYNINKRANKYDNEIIDDGEDGQGQVLYEEIDYIQEDNEYDNNYADDNNYYAYNNNNFEEDDYDDNYQNNAIYGDDYNQNYIQNNYNNNYEEEYNDDVNNNYEVEYNDIIDNNYEDEYNGNIDNNNYEIDYENDNYIEGDYDERYEDTQYLNDNQYYNNYNNDYYDENEEDYYYEEPENQKLSYYLTNTQKNNQVRYITNNTNISYIKPKVTYNKAPANIYNYSNSGVNDKYKYIVSNNTSKGVKTNVFRGNNNLFGGL